MTKKISTTIIISILFVSSVIPSASAISLEERCKTILKRNPNHKLCSRYKIKTERELKTENLRVKMEKRILFLTNRERAKKTLSPLTIHKELSRSAQKHAEDMAMNNFFDHINLHGVSPSDRIKNTLYLQEFNDCNCNRSATVGENLAHNQQNPIRVVKDWMRSLEHRRNILKKDYKHLGVGFVKDDRKTWWVQNFGGYELNLSEK
jgi:uncharacterized protein YkwD